MGVAKAPSRKRAQSVTTLAPAVRPAFTYAGRVAFLLVAFIVTTVPIAVSLTGKDAFRSPKDSLFLAGGLLLIAGVAVCWPARKMTAATPLPRSLAWSLIGLTLWTMFTALTSTNHRISAVSILWFASATAFLIIVMLLGRSWPIWTAYLLFMPALLNAAVFLLQRFHVWNPFQFDASIPPHQRYSALAGNPDDAGSFFVAPAIVALALAISDKRRRAVTLPILALLLASVLTGPLTSAVACVAGAVALLFLHSRRAGVVGTSILVVAITLFAFGFTPLRERLSTIHSLAAAGNYAEATSGRVTPFLAAILMMRDHPITGVGPSCFRWEYFAYKLRVESMHPRLAAQFSHSFNFGEAHNDHLQTLAETGVVGYALGLAVLVAIGLSSFRRRPLAETDDVRLNAARLICLPLAIALWVLSLGHFPLHLAAASVAFFFPAGLAFSWLQPDERLNVGARQMRPIQLIAGTVIAAAALAAAYFFAYRPYAANQVKNVVERSTSATLNMADPYVRARAARANIAHVEGCANQWLPDIDCCMLLAANYRIIGRAADAVAMYERALRYERRPELYFSLADTQLGTGDTRSAVANFAQAVRFNRDILAEVPQSVRDEVALAAAQSVTQ